MDIRIDESLRSYIDPLTPDEYEALERSLLAEGCRDALVLWGDLLVDGHNRYAICQRHGIAFRTVQNERFRDLDDVRLWMIDNHLGRRSVSDYQRGVLALRRKEILLARREQTQAAGGTGQAGDGAGQGQGVPWDTAGDAAGRAGGAGTEGAAADGAEDASAAGRAGAGPASRALSRQELARAARVSAATLGQIEKIHRTAAPPVVEAVRSGALSISAAATLAELPEAEQAAAAAGGSRSLREAARAARAARAAARPQPARDPGEVYGEPCDDPAQEIARLRELIWRLTEERDALRKKVANLTVALSEARQRGG